MSNCTKLMRLESDSIGTKELPADVYYGVQSLRGFENFQITGQRLRTEFINSLAEIKKTLKTDEAKIKEFNKTLATKQSELDNLNIELEAKSNTLAAKIEMQGMTPQLATIDDVNAAGIAVNEAQAKIEAKKQEIAVIEENISNLNTAISALKSRL